MYDVTAYGALGDGVTDDCASIQAAIDAAEAAGGGVVFFPAGIYLLDSSHPVETGVALNIDDDNVYLEGVGRGISKIRLGDDLNISLINFQGVVGGGISKLEIDGNRLNQSANSHGIRSGGHVSRWCCKDVYIHDVSSYGIGLQHGTLKDLVIDTVWIEDTGGDGIDIKNQEDNNQNIQLDHITVRRAGLRLDLDDLAAIDVRGPCKLNMIDIKEFANDGVNGTCQSGIRFRQGEPNDASGLGGHHSTLTNFFIQALNTTATEGVRVAAAQVTINTGQILGCDVGMGIYQTEVTAGQVVAKLCAYGFWLGESTYATDSDRAILTGCVARLCSNTGFRPYTSHNIINGCSAYDNGTGINVRPQADRTQLSGVAYGNSSTNLSNNGSNTNSTDMVTV